MSEKSWFIIKKSSEQCEIIEAQTQEAVKKGTDTQPIETWGPFDTKNQAIAKRVGLIRAGKCKPS